MKASYKLCKKCLIDNIGWNDIAEAWATKGCVLSDHQPIIGCPSTLVNIYTDLIKMMIVDFINPKFKDIHHIEVLPEYNHNLMFLGRDVPQWCPYYDTN